MVKNQEPVCECQQVCQGRYDPVCGSDNRTYGNPCELDSMACVLRREIRVKHKGPCGKEPASWCSRRGCLGASVLWVLLCTGKGGESGIGVRPRPWRTLLDGSGCSELAPGGCRIRPLS